ncbi:AMP-binding protein [Thiolapillus sp.]
MVPVNADFRLIHAGRTFAGTELEDTRDPLCPFLAGLGLRPGMTLVCRSARRELLARLLFLLPRMGCLFLPLDPDLPSSLSARLVDAAGPHLFIDDSLVPQPLPPGGRELAFQPLTARDPALLLATSGTTGEPRLVELTGANLESSVRASCGFLDLGAADCWLACLPLHHVGGLSVLLRAAWRGATAVLMERFSVQELTRLLHEHEVSHLSLVPAMLHRLLAEDCSPPSSLRVVLLGGAPARQSLVARAMDRGWPVCPSYGLTEAASQVATVYPPDRRWQEGLAGRCLPHVELKLEAPEGRICLRGSSIARWYRDGRGERRLLQDARGWLHTGDAGWLDDRGRLHVKGRLDDMLISGGENIHPAMVEAVFQNCPGVEEAALTALDDPRWGDALVLLYRGQASSGEVHAWARQHLQAAHLPRHFLRVNRLPRNSMGKLLRRELRHLARAGIQSVHA